MKKVLFTALSLILICTLLLGMVSCNNGNTVDTNNNFNNSQTNNDNTDGSQTNNKNTDNSSSKDNDADESQDEGLTHSHTYDKKKVTEAYLASSATCTSPAIYYYSCECGDKGTETFTDGDSIAHTYNKKNVTEAYLASSATCTSPAIYYYSCECGDKGTETFTDGEKSNHIPVNDAEVAATCLSSGLTAGSHCQECGITITAQTVIPAKGHSIVEDSAVSATCTKSGLTEGSHCSVCQATIVVQDIVPATGHDYKEATYSSPATCRNCGATSGIPLQKQPIYITKPYMPTIQYDTFKVTSCSYSTSWNGDGTYDVTVTFYYTNITYSTITAGIWATLSGIEPWDGTVKTLSPGASGSCVVEFFNVPSGSYQIIIDN